jgi:hypothetical protein
MLCQFILFTRVQYFSSNKHIEEHFIPSIESSAYIYSLVKNVTCMLILACIPFKDVCILLWLT